MTEIMDDSAVYESEDDDDDDVNDDVEDTAIFLGDLYDVE